MSSLTSQELLLRLCLAFAAGFVIGWERESHGRAAGLRTTILACIGSAVAMIVNELVTAQMAASSPDGIRSDPTRLGAGILAGFGFLGAGVIMRNENAIRGVTTAASLWFGSVMGLAFGSGQFFTGFVGTGLALLTLVALPLFEKSIHSDAFAKLSITLALDGLAEQDLKQRVEGLGAVVKNIRLDYDLGVRQKTYICDLLYRKRHDMEVSARIVNDLTQVAGVLRVKWE